MPDKPHRSRTGWRAMAAKPDEDDLVPGMPFHYHRTPPWVVRCVLAVLALSVLNLAGLILVYVHDYQQQQFIEGRGEQRDRENARLEEQMRQAQCDLLDTFPEGVPALERARAKYECGPGIPRALLTPEEQARYGPAPAAPSPAPLASPPPLGSAAVPGAPRPVPNVPLPAEPAPDPLVDLGPITGPACDSLGVCG